MVCVRCLLLDALVPPSCWACREPAPRGVLCDACEAVMPWLDRPCTRLRSGPLDAAWAPLAYAGPARDLVHTLKFRNAPGVARGMARHITDGVPPHVFSPGWTIVPVPAHPGRRRARGFDHADALARALARRTGLPLARALRRGGGSHAHQRGLGRAARLAGAGLRIDVTGPPIGRVLLVDDVRTTGATVAVCAAALRARGTSRVVAVSYAHVA